MNFQYYPVATSGKDMLFLRVGDPKGEDFVNYPKHFSGQNAYNALLVRDDGIFPVSLLSLVTREYQDWKSIKGNKLSEFVLPSDRSKMTAKETAEYQKGLYDRDASVLSKYADQSQQKWTATPAVLQFLDDMKQWGLPMPSNAADADTAKKSTTKAPRKIQRMEKA